MSKKRTRKKKGGIPKSKIMSCVRRIWLYSEPRKQAKNRAKTPDGYFRCERCRALTEDVAIDHIDAVVPLTGFDTYDGAFARLFCPPEGMQALCHKCHSAKTSYEANARKEARKKKLIVDKEDKKE